MRIDDEPDTAEGQSTGEVVEGIVSRLNGDEVLVELGGRSAA